jgi:hypothetical protein
MGRYLVVQSFSAVQTDSFDPFTPTIAVYIVPDLVAI